MPLFFVDLAITSPSFSAGVVQDSWAERGRVLVILRCTQISASSECKLSPTLLLESSMLLESKKSAAAAAQAPSNGRQPLQSTA